MEFTREAWENAPEGVTLEYDSSDWTPVTLIGFSANGRPVVEDSRGRVWASVKNELRIILPKRKVTVQLWRTRTGDITSTTKPDFRAPEWTLLGEHTFEVEGE